MKQFKEVRFFSTLLSATVVSLNALSSPIASSLEVKSEAWLICSMSSGASIDCNNTETYVPIRDLDLIDKLKQELKLKNENELLSRTVELSYDEIDVFFTFLSSGKPVYQEPKVRFDMLDPLSEIEFKKQLRDIENEIVKNKIINPETLYNNPKLKLDIIPKKTFDEIVNKYRRNNYAIENPKGGAYVVCGVVGTVAAVKAMDIVGSKMGSKTNPGGGGNFTIRNIEQRDEELMKKIIPLVPNQDKCNDR